MSDRVGTPRQVADSLETYEARILDLINAGLLPAIFLGERKVVVPWHALDIWLLDEGNRNLLAAPPDVLAKKRRRGA